MIISVIIATCNRCETLKTMLRTLVNQECDRSFDYEFLIVDNNSNDRTKETVESFINQGESRFKYIFEPIQGKSYALNKAIAHAKGDIVAFVDDDVIVDSQWLLNIKKCFQEYGCDGVGGRILPDYPKNTPQWIKDNIDILVGTIVAYDYGQKVQKYGKPLYEFLGANYAFRKSLFTDYGLFRTDLGVGTSCLGEDTEIVNRFVSYKKNLYYCGPAIVWHPVDLNRARLSYIAKWNIGLGRYRIRSSEHKNISADLKYIANIPLYLIRQMGKNGIGLILNIFNKREFLKNWINLSINWGKALEIKEMRKKTLK